MLDYENKLFKSFKGISFLKQVFYNLFLYIIIAIIGFSFSIAAIQQVADADVPVQKFYKSIDDISVDDDYSTFRLDEEQGELVPAEDFEQEKTEGAFFESMFFKILLFVIGGVVLLLFILGVLYKLVAGRGIPVQDQDTHQGADDEILNREPMNLSEAVSAYIRHKQGR